MKTNQDKKPLKKRDAGDVRRVYNRKLNLQYGDQMAFLDWHDICAHTACSKSTAYRWIENPDSIPQPMLELLQLKALGAIPIWGEGWRIDGDGIRLPSGHTIKPHDLQNVGQYADGYRSAAKENEKLRTELKRIERLLGIPKPILKRITCESAGLELIVDNTPKKRLSQD